MKTLKMYIFFYIHFILIGCFNGIDSFLKISNNETSSNININDEQFLQYKQDFEKISTKYLNDTEHCDCDSTLNYCDIECCCDLKCTDIDRYVFRKCRSFGIEDKNQLETCHFINNQRDFIEKNKFNYLYTSSPMLCLVKDNVRVKKSFVYNKVISDKSQLGNIESKHKFFWTYQSYQDVDVSTKQIQNITLMKSLVKYKSGYRIIRFSLKQTNKNNTIQYYYWKLPFSMTFKNGQCNQLKHVQYLYDYYSICSRSLIDIKKSCTNEQYLDYRIYLNSDVFLYNKFANESYKFVQIQSKKSYNVTYFDSKLNICHNVVGKVEYTIFHEGIKGIREVHITIDQMDLFDSEKVIQQIFNVTFIWYGRTKQQSSIEQSSTNNNKNNIGYVFGKKILFSKLVINDTKRNVDLNLLGVYRNGLCDKQKKIKDKIINFGMNRINSCRLNIDLITPKRNVCFAIMYEIDKYLGHDNLDGEHLYVASFANARINHSVGWIKTIVESNTNENSTLLQKNYECNIITGVFYRIFIIKLDQIRYQIIGTDINKKATSLDLKCLPTDEQKCNISASIDLVTLVNFIDLSEPFVPNYAPAPSIKIELPSDFFYPFLTTTSAKACRRFCKNGYCGQNGECECHPCWTGFRCNQYDDQNKVFFKKKFVNLYLKQERISEYKPFYIVKAIDKDSLTCGHFINCSCAHIEYKLQIEEKYQQWFKINSTSGEIFVLEPKKLELEKQYKLLAIAFNPKSMFDFSSQLTIFIKLQNKLNRIKRQAPMGNDAQELNSITFGLRTIAGETNSLQVGNSIHYRLEIALPRGQSDLVLEIQTLDSPMSNRTSLSLYNFSIPYESTGIQFNIPEPKFHLSNKTANVFDRLTLDFGSIKNTGPERNVMTICFSVVLVRKPRKAKKKHSVIVGVEHSKGSLTWVAESEITTTSLLSKDDQIFCEAQLIESPKKIALDSAVTFRFDVNLQFRSELFKVVLNKSSYEYEPDNLISLGLISATKFGKNFQALPNTPRYYVGYRNKTVSRLSYSQSVLDMNIITNNGEKSRIFTRNPSNIISFIFTIYALNFKENVGQNASFNINLYIGRRSYYSKTFNLTIITRNDNERIQSFLLDSDGNFTIQHVLKGGITRLKIRSKFHNFTEHNVFTDYSLIIEDTPQLPFIPCAARLIDEESGINLPYLNPNIIKPIQKSKTFVFNFGRLNFVKLINSFSIEDNYVVVEITFKIPFNFSTIDGNEFIIQANQVKVVSGYKIKSVYIEKQLLSSYIEDNTNQSSIEINTFSSVKWNDLIISGGVAINVELEFPPNTAYQDFRISIMRDPNSLLSQTLPDLNICRFTVVEVDNMMPCIYVEKETINNKQIIYDNSHGKNISSFYDKATIDFGSISVVNGSNFKQKILTNFAVMISDNISAEQPQQSYPIKIDIISHDDIIASDVVTLNISNMLPDTIVDMSIDLEVELLEKKSVIPGFTTNVLIKVHTAPNTMGFLDIKVYSENEMISICGLWVHRVGYNLPCVDQNKKAEYDFNNNGQNKEAILHFDMITNFGNHVRKSERDERNDNTLEFIAMVRILEEATNNQTLKVKVNHSHKDITTIKDLLIPVEKENHAIKEYSQPRKITLKTYDNNKFVQHGVPKLFYFDIELEENSQTSLTITMDPSNDYKMCNAAFIKVGKNYPCYSPFSLNVKPNQFELGIICHTYLNKQNPEDNIIRLAFALRPSENIKSTLPFQVSGLVYVGQLPFNQKYELPMTVDADYIDRFPIDKGATVEAEFTDSIGFKIRERKWIVFNIHIPAFSTGKLTTVVKGQTDKNRAFIVLYDLRIVYGGQNIPCPFENLPKLRLNSTINNNQTNVINADLGWFSNFGYTYYIDKNISDKFDDDLLKVEVLAELTDHPSLIENDVYKLNFEVHFGNLTNSITTETAAKIRLLSVDEPNPKFDVNIRYNKRMRILDRNETFTIEATIRHSPNSNAEPSDSVLRMFAPNFVEIININWANTKELPALIRINESSTDISFPWILFNEEFVVNFTVQIDPKNTRGYGRKEVTIITPFRMMCQHFRVKTNTKFPCSQMKHINYRTESSECNIPLGMESGKILDSQISASPTISKKFSPQSARPNSKSFWSPSVRNWKNEHYLQIDFRQKTRLVRLVFKSISNMRRISSYHINYSNDGKVWFQATNITHITYNGEIGKSSIEKPIETRLVRLVIDNVVNSENSTNQYIAVKFELYGCYLDSNSSSSFQSLDFSTHYTDDTLVKNRHISIDPFTNVIYFCDATSNDNYYICYYSDSGGNSWNIIGRSIDSFEGFELATGKFYAIDYDRPSYFYSADGHNWTPIDYELFNATVSHSKFQKKIIIPRFNKEDLNKMNIRLGNWQVNYEGLNHEDYQGPKAFWSKCCGLE